jgi:hypothetical protein
VQKLASGKPAGPDGFIVTVFIGLHAILRVGLI